MKTITIVAVVVVAVLFVGVLSLHYTLTPKPHVEISSFNSTGTSSGSSLGVVNVWFVLNLTNTGAGDVEDLTVTFSTNKTIENYRQLTYANSTLPHDNIFDFEMGQPCLLGELKAGETKVFMFYWPVSIDFDAPPLTATLKSNEAILDQATVTIPPRPKVKITNFICLDIHHNTPLGLFLDLFSLSYTNHGITDVENLTVTLSTSKVNKTDTGSPQPTPNPYYENRPFYEYINGETYPLESLKAGETKTFEKSYWISESFLVEPFNLTVTLKSNGTILDQATIMIPISIIHR